MTKGYLESACAALNQTQTSLFSFPACPDFVEGSVGEIFAYYLNLPPEGGSSNQFCFSSPGCNQKEMVCKVGTKCSEGCRVSGGCSYYNRGGRSTSDSNIQTRESPTIDNIASCSFKSSEQGTSSGIGGPVTCKICQIK